MLSLAVSLGLLLLLLLLALALALVLLLHHPLLLNALCLALGLHLHVSTRHTSLTSLWLTNLLALRHSALLTLGHASHSSLLRSLLLLGLSLSHPHLNPPGVRLVRALDGGHGRLGNRFILEQLVDLRPRVDTLGHHGDLVKNLLRNGQVSHVDPHRCCLARLGCGLDLGSGLDLSSRHSHVSLSGLTWLALLLALLALLTLLTLLTLLSLALVLILALGLSLLPLRLRSHSSLRSHSLCSHSLSCLTLHHALLLSGGLLLLLLGRPLLAVHRNVLLLLLAGHRLEHLDRLGRGRNALGL